MLNSKMPINEKNTKSLPMTEISKQDFENVSLFAHHICLKILFGVLANHNSKLAADIAMELSRAQTVLPDLMRENYAPYVHAELQKWIDSLSENNQPNE